MAPNTIPSYIPEKSGQRVALPAENLFQKGDDLYVKDSLFLGRPLHSRITWGHRQDPAQPPRFRADTLRRIQDVHNAILRALSAQIPLHEGKQVVVDPTLISIRLEKGVTQIILNQTGAVIAPGEIPLLPEDAAWLPQTAAKTVHAAMQYLKNEVLALTPPGDPQAIVPRPLPAVRAPEPAPAPPGGAPPPGGGDAPEEEADVAGAEEILRRARAGEPIGPPLSKEAFKVAMEERMNQVDVAKLPHWPIEWPQAVTFEGVCQQQHPVIQRALMKLVRDPGCHEVDAQAVRGLLCDWATKAYEFYRYNMPVDPETYLDFKKRYELEESEETLERYLQYHSLVEWFQLLSFEGQNLALLQEDILRYLSQ